MLCKDIKNNQASKYIKHQELPLWSRGRVDGSRSGGPRFDPHVRPKTFYHILDGCSRITSYVAHSRGLLLFVMIYTPKGMSSDLKIDCKV